MKRILFYILLILPFFCEGQTATPIVQGAKYYEFKNGLRVDSALFIPRKDTLFFDNTLKAPGLLTWRPQDSIVYYYSGVRWLRITPSAFLALDSALYNPSDGSFTFRKTDGSNLVVNTGLVDSLLTRMKYSDTTSLSNRIDNTEDSIQANDLQRVTERGNITNRELILDTGSGAGAGRLRMRTAGANVVYSYETGATAFKPLLLATGGLLVSNPSGSPVTWDGNSSIQISGDGKVNDNWAVGGDLSVTGSTILAQQKNNIAEDSVLTTDIDGHLKMVAKNSITSAYTPLTRELTVGTGMTGGGDFSADRSVGLDYSYLDDRYLSGYKQRAAVRVATIANITLSAPQTIDGVAAIAGDRVLVKNQTTGSQNGIYIVAAGAWSRSTDFDQAIPGEIEQGSQIFVQEGTNNNKTGWSLATSGAITVGTTTLTFIQYAGANSYAAGTGLALTGNTFSALNTTALWNASKVQGIGVSTTAPTTSQLLRYDGTNWAPWTSNYITGNQTITATGDATGSGTTSIPLTLRNTGTAGTYTKVTTDAQGRVTVGTNPTTLAGYGITDAAPSNLGLSGVLSNGNTADNSLTLGSPGNGNQRIFTTIRNISGVDYNATLAIGLPGVTILSSGNGTIANNKNLYLPFAGSTVQYSPDNGAAKYDVWHSNNHPAGTVFTGAWSGNNVIGSLTTNTAGHVTGMTTRTMTLGDLGAAPATGSVNYVQSQSSAAQASSSFWVSGIGVASQINTTAATGGAQSVMHNGVYGTGTRRWAELLANTEAAGNLGNDYSIASYDNSGNFIRTNLQINRATGITYMYTGFRGLSGSGSLGTGTGAANISNLSFYESDGNTRKGYVGDGASANSDMYLLSDAGDIKLAPAGTGPSPTLHIYPTGMSLNGGLFSLTNGTANIINFNTYGLGDPTVNTRSPGAKIVLRNTLTSGSGDNAIGVSANADMWFQIPDNTRLWKWYAAANQVASLSGTGAMTLSGSLTTQNVLSPASADLNIKGDLDTRFFNDGIERVTISSDGILSVGNSSPSTLRSSPLQVQGNIWSTDAYLLGTGSVPIGEFGIGGTGIFVRSMDAVTNIDFMTNGTTQRGKFNATTGNFELNNQIKIAGGSPGVGKQLTSDASGLATWSGAVTTTTRAVTGNVTITSSDYSIDLKGTGTGSTHTLTLPDPAVSEGRELEFFATASTASAWTANYPIYNRNQDTMPPNTRPNILGREKIKVISGKWVVVTVQD